MVKKSVFGIGVCLLVLSFLVTTLHAADLDRLSRQVARLKLERNGYVLGAALNQDQIRTAMANPVQASVPGTYKFQDNNLFVVVQETTHRVLVIYEQFEQASQKQVQDLIGDLYINFEEPTIIAHEKVVYWAYSKTGKISVQAYDTAKKDKKTLDFIATVKCISDVKIMTKSKEPVQGMVYYVISSDPMLQFFKDKIKIM
ncbi:MAG: hypothetical protein ABIJ59_08460 [Pseudomonadota bacterium]